ncbi:Putative ribonuclease H protein At1g65750 [Linum perenne]
MERGSRSGLRNGRDTLFWTSRWLDDGSRLIDLADESNPRISLDDSFVLQTGDWDLARIRDLLPPAAVNSVAGMTPPNDSLGEDAWSWGGESNGKFTIRSAYNLITGSSSPPTGTDWKKVWNWRGPNKIRLFLWLASHNKLLTNEERRRRHLAGDDSCPRCPGRCESSTHVIKDCPFAVEVWRLLGLDQIAFPAGLSHHDNWIFQHLSHEEGLLFGCVFWALWKSRNELVFNGVTVSAQATAYRIASWVKTVEDSLSRDQRLGGQPVHERSNLERGCGGGGLVRNSSGHCLLAFTANLGSCSITRAELWGILIGLRLAWNAGYKKIIVQTDSQVAVQLLTDDSSTNHHHGLEVTQFKEFNARS